MYIGPEDMTEEFSLSPTGLAACIETVNHTSYTPFVIINNPAGSVVDITSLMVIIKIG